jgi:hypothetical protein
MQNSFKKYQIEQRNAKDTSSEIWKFAVLAQKKSQKIPA